NGHASRQSDATDPNVDNFATCLMLAIAYAASIGGVATIIGTPPNVFLVGFLRDTIQPEYRMELSFARWLLIGIPLAALYLPVAWWLMTRVLYPVSGDSIPGGRGLITEQLLSLGKPNSGERATFFVFLSAVFFWV